VLNQSTRTTILELHRKGVGKRTIARTLAVSRGVVRDVIQSDTVTPPPFNRAERAEPFRREILDLFDSCKGNLVRVHEELEASGVKLSYPAFTAFCRRAGIGGKPAVPAGQYHFEPGDEVLCGIPHSISYAAPGNMRRPSKPMALMAGGDAVVV